MKKASVRLNILGPARWLLASPAFPFIFQIGALGVVFLLIINGFGLGLDMGADELMTFRKTNLTTLVVWGLWWPGMIIVALIFGRLWCTVCPMELVNRIGDGIARKVGWTRAGLGKTIRAGWMIVVLYLVLQLLVAGVSLHRVPHFTAILLLVLLGGALLTGLVFRRPRSFCRAFCPAGALLSVYGRHTPFQLETLDSAVCESCTTKDCIEKENRFRFDKRSCPSMLRPFQRDASDGCVLCLQCAKVCPHENVGLGLAAPESPIRQKGLLKPFEAAFVMVALGFVAHEVIGEIRWLDSIFHIVPEWLTSVAPFVPFGWFEALWFLVLFPIVVWAVIVGAGFLAGHRSGLRKLILAAATGAAPVVAIAHMAKALAKVSSWGGFFPRALDDPQGLETYMQLAQGAISSPTKIASLSLLGWVMFILVLLLTWRAFRWSRQVPRESKMATRVGLVGASVLFAPVLIVWALSGS